MLRRRALGGLGVLLVAICSLVAGFPAAAAVLRTGQTWGPGDSIDSPNHFVSLTLQGDGNLVLRAGGAALWATGTAGHAGATLELQSDGNLVLRAAGGAALWVSGTRGSGAFDTLQVTNDGTALLTDAARHRLWSTGTRATTLPGGRSLQAGQFLTSPAGQVLIQQADGNLVLYQGSRPLWNTRTDGHPGARADLQTDGNLVVRGRDGRALWASGTRGVPRPALVALSGSVTLVGGSGRVAWQAPAPRPAPALPSTGARLAARLLALWGPRFSGLPGVLSDLRTVAAGRTITNSDSCGRTVTIDPRLLAVLLRLTGRYQVVLNNIITGHGCDSALHPRGQATDIARITDPTTGATTNFHSYTGGDDTALDARFVVYLAGLLPVGAGLGQRDCPGHQVALPAGIAFFADSCTHQHVQVGSG